MSGLDIQGDGVVCAGCRAPLRVSAVMRTELSVDRTAVTPASEHAPFVECDNCGFDMGSPLDFQRALEGQHEALELLRAGV